MHNFVTSHLWLKSALHASSHPCMCTCVLRLGCFLLACLVLYFVPPFSFQPFLMFTSEFNERSRSNPLCDFRLGTVVTSDHETPLTPQGAWDHIEEDKLLEFAESGHPIFRATTPLSRGQLKSKGRGKLSIHFTADQDTVDTIYRIILSVNQLSVYGAVAVICEELEDHQD